MVILVLVVVVFIVLFLLLHRLPPGPSLLQRWRNRSLFQKKQPHVALKELAAIYGPLLSLRVGTQLIVVASSPSMAELILKTNSLSFYYDVPGAKNASLDCDASWNFIFSPKALGSAATILKAKVMEMVMVKMTQREKGGVNIEHSFSAAFSNIVAGVLASRDLFESGGVGLRDEKVMKFLHEIVEMATVPGLVDVFSFLEGLDLWSKRRTVQVYRRVKLIWGDFIKDRRRSSFNGGGDDGLNSKRDFLDVLKAHSFDDDQIAYLLSEIIIAATDTTAVTSVWLMAELIKMR